nr:reverse transcriptase domain-containing protein [Tanacetum cinerariifolium]
TAQPRWENDLGKLFAAPDLLIKFFFVPFALILKLKGVKEPCQILALLPGRSSSRLTRDQSSKKKVENSNLEEHLPPIVTMADNHTMVDSYVHPPKDQDSLNAAAGGNLLERSTQDVLTIIKNKSKQTSDVTTAMTAMLKQFHATPPPAPVKAVEEICVTCGGAHPYYKCLAAGGTTFPEFKNNIQGYVSAAVVNYNQGNLGYRPQGVANQIRPPVANPKGDLKVITTRSGVSYDGPLILPLVVENEPEATKDTVNPTNNETTEDVQPQVVQSKPVTFELANTPVSALKPNPKALIPYPSRRNDKRNHEKAKDQIEKFNQIFKDMSFEISFTDALILMPKFASTLKSLIENKEKLSEMARTPLNEHCSAVLLKKLPEKLGDPGKFLI